MSKICSFGSCCQARLQSFWWLTRWGRDKMAAVFRTFSNAFAWMKLHVIWILISILLKFVPRISVNNIPATIEIMAWRRPGDRQLSEPMMVSLLTNICVTQTQWVNSGQTTKTLTEENVIDDKSTLVQAIAWTNFDHILWRRMTHQGPKS